MTATEWYTPPMGPRTDPAEARAHMLASRVMRLEDELREVRDENTRLRKQQVVCLAMVTESADEALRYARLLIAEREARRGVTHG